MDVSVFNTLISTTDSDNPFGITPAPAPAPKNTVSTGEAFLNVLNQVRNGKTEKSSEAVFSTLTSRAETSANAKKIGTSDNASQNVRVIKVHLKRTRSSSTLAKAEAQPAEKPQEKQSLPSMETAQPSEQSPSSVTLTADNAVKQSDFEQKAVEKITEQPADLPTDATAADILLFAALPVEKPVETEQAESFAPVKADDAAPVEQSAPDKTTDILPSQVPEQTESAPRQTERAPEQIKQQPVQFAEKQETPVPVQTAENPVIKRETAQNEPERQAEVPPEQIETVPVEAAENTVKAQPVKTEIKAVKADTKTMRIQPLQTETAEIADAPAEAAPEHFERAQKQAEKLAKELPADTKIALTVETQTAQPAVALKTASALPAEHKEARASAKAQAETEQAESFAPLTAESSAPQKAPAAQPTPRAAPAQQQEQQQQIRQNDAFQPLFAPVQSAVQNVEAAETAPSAAVSAVSNTAAAQPAVFTAPNELKGKAVSAPVVSQKQTPVNDLVDQIKVKITKAFKDGTDKIEIILRPKELGTIRVRLETDKDGKTTVHLTASRAETIDMLQRDVSALKQALNDAGLNTSDQAFTFNYRGEEQQNSAHEQKTASFLHNEAQAESETQDSPEDFGNHALNIRV